MEKRSQYLKFLLVLGLFSTNKHCFSAPEDDEIPEGWTVKQGEIDPEIRTVTDPEGKQFLFIPTAPRSKAVQKTVDQNLYNLNAVRSRPPGWKPTSELYPSDVTNENVHADKIAQRRAALFAKNPNLFTTENAKKFGLIKSMQSPDNLESKDLLALTRVVSLPDPGEEDLGIPSKRASMPSQEDNEAKIREIADEIINDFNSEKAEKKQKFISGLLEQMDMMNKSLKEDNLDPEAKQEIQTQLEAFRRLPEIAIGTDFLAMLEKEKAKRGSTASIQGLSDEDLSSRRSYLISENIDDKLTNLANKTIEEHQKRLLLEEAHRKYASQTTSPLKFVVPSSIPGVPQKNPLNPYFGQITHTQTNPISGYKTENTIIPDFHSQQKHPTPQGFSAAGYSSSKPRKQ